MPTKTEPLLPPDETFWQRYSPHHELPLAGMTSLFAHGMVIGVIVLAALLMMFNWESDAGKPPSMDVVQVSGLGDGMEGAGAEPGAPGDVQSMRKEYVPNLTKDPPEASTDVIPNLKEAPKKEFQVPEITPVKPADDIESLLNNLEKDANNQAKKESAKSPPKLAVASGTGNPKGLGGQGGSGGGPGKGVKGTGLGAGGPLGRKATNAEIYAKRWQFELMSSTIAGGQKEHVAKLIAMGVIVAFVDAKGTVYFAQDLRRRPVSLKVGSMEKYNDAVKWTNQSAASIYHLAMELRLPFTPVAEVILLPKDREQAIADEEMRFAQNAGRDPKTIQNTWFDFRLRNGAYEPVVVKQE
jgi:hypothetical protein